MREAGIRRGLTSSNGTPRLCTTSAELCVALGPPAVFIRGFNLGSHCSFLRSRPRKVASVVTNPRLLSADLGFVTTDAKKLSHEKLNRSGGLIRFHSLIYSMQHPYCLCLCCAAVCVPACATAMLQLVLPSCSCPHPDRWLLMVS